MKLKGSCWHCFWLSSAGAHPHPFLLIGPVVAKCLPWVPGKVLCSLQQVWSEKGEKEKFRWSSGSTLKKEEIHFEYHIMDVNRVRRGRGLFLDLSLGYYKSFFLPFGSGRSWDALSQAVSVVPALVPGELLVSLSYFLSSLYCCFLPTLFF